MASAQCFDLENLKALSLKEENEVLKNQSEAAFSVLDLSERINDSALIDYLSHLGEETIIYRIFYLDGTVQSSIPKFYIDEKDNLQLYDAQSVPKPIPIDINFHSHETDFIKSEEQNSQTVLGRQTFYLEKEGQKLAFIAPIGIKTEYVEAVKEKYKKGEAIDTLLAKNKGMVPTKIVKYCPRPLKPKNDFQVGEAYKILQFLGPDPRYTGKTRYLMQQLNGDKEVGEPFETLNNRTLDKHWRDFNSQPCQVVKKTNKEGAIIVEFRLRSLVQAS